jgi:hypothetical protein
VRDDPIALLERELLDAAHRRAVLLDEPDASSHEPRGPRPQASRPARRRSSLGAFAAVALSGAAVAVALGALVSLHGRSASTQTRASAPAAPSSARRQLIDILGVLRRPQTPADLRILPQLTNVSTQVGIPDRPLIRYATTTPWGEKLYFVPTSTVMAGQRVEELSVLSSQGGSGGARAAEIEAGQEIGTQGGAGIRGTRVTVVVPDGVASVKLVLPRQPFPGQYGAPIYPHSIAVTTAVHGNVAALQIDRQSGIPFPMIWYGPDGQVVKRIGNLAGANQVVPTPRPGPETALSRAAERDPSTPDRVWVTPSVGGPNTRFTVHFRVLLNNADYSYRLSGTRCPAITPSGGGGGGTDDLRGRIWSDSIDAVQGQVWCPGTYHLSVAVMGRAHASPFGTATFTVIR